MDDAPAFLKVLGSGSSGNCSVLLLQGAERPLFWLIDAGLSPRRTRRLLMHAGLSPEGLEGILLTHLDSDHWHLSWRKVLSPAVRLVVHESHARSGFLPDWTETHRPDSTLTSRFGIRCHLAAHDETGATSFRIQVSCDGRTATLGFATDVGHADGAFLEHLRGVDVLAIESNYCPRLQMASQRPSFLKARIMGGRGHLSNQQCARAVRAIAPRRHVVLLHLSRQCNTPELALAEHAGRDYELTITSQHMPTPWIPVVAGPERLRPIPEVEAPLFQQSLFAAS
jgi:phosphoribosyl 1,2-cyclic phosphodiesterase